MAKQSEWSKKREGFRHQLVEAVRAKGFSYRKATKVVDLTLKCVLDALVRGEQVCCDDLTLLPVRRKNPKRRAYRFGRIVEINQDPFTYEVILHEEQDPVTDEHPRRNVL